MDGPCRVPGSLTSEEQAVRLTACPLSQPANPLPDNEAPAPAPAPAPEPKGRKRKEAPKKPQPEAEEEAGSSTGGRPKRQRKQVAK